MIYHISDGTKQLIGVVATALSMIGITSADIPNIFVLVLGAGIGTALAAAVSSQDGIKLPKNWIWWRLSMCAFFALFVLFLQWLTGITDGRPTGLVMGVLSYYGRDAVNMIASGTFDQIKERVFKVKK